MIKNPNPEWCEKKKTKKNCEAKFFVVRPTGMQVKKEREQTNKMEIEQKRANKLNDK